jgi:hypothetical protein
LYEPTSVHDVTVSDTQKSRTSTPPAAGTTCTVVRTGSAVNGASDRQGYNGGTEQTMGVALAVFGAAAASPLPSIAVLTPGSPRQEK